MSETTTLGIARKGLSPALQGILWKVLSVACFVVINTLVKSLSLSEYTANPLHVNVIHFYQNLVALFFLIPVILKIGSTPLKFKNPTLHTTRIAGHVLGMLFWYLAIQQLPMAQCVALNFLGPIFTVIGAWLLLGEFLNSTRVFAIALSFMGAIIVLYPKLQGWTQGLNSWECLFPVFAAICLCANKLSTRRLSFLGEKPEFLTALIIIACVPVTFVMALFYWSTPSIEQFPHIMAIGALTALAHYALSRAYCIADAVLLAPFGFMKFLFSVIMGYIFFSEIPTDIRLWVGTFIILTGLIIITLSKTHISKQPRSA